MIIKNCEYTLNQKDIDAVQRVRGMIHQFCEAGLCKKCPFTDYANDCAEVNDILEIFLDNNKEV